MRRWSDTISQTRAGDASMWIDASRGGTRSDMAFDLSCSQLARGAVTGVEPLDQEVGDPRVVEQREVVRARHVRRLRAVDDQALPGDTCGRRGVDEEVAEHRAQRVPLGRAERGGDEVVAGARQWRGRDAIEAPLGGEVLPLPLVVADVSVAEVDDAGGSGVEDPAERPRLGHDPKDARA